MDVEKRDAPVLPCPDEPDEDVLSMRAAAEAHRMVKLCHLAGIVKPCGRGRTYVEAVGRCDCANP